MRKTFALILLTALLTACAGAAPSPSPSPNPLPTPSPSPIPSPNPEADLYLRASYAQALPPPATFAWLPMLTIDEGTVIDGNVAVPAIYPGPLLITPIARSISDAGIAAIIAEARRMGLLNGVTDFTGGPMPGARVGQLLLTIDGVDYELVGDPERAVQCANRCAPGTPEAFAAFWQELSFLDPWIGAELGAPGQYNPERVAVLLTPPAPPEPGLEQQPVTWPLDESFFDLGVEFPGQAGARCATFSGADLDKVLPVLLAANQLTVFHDIVDGQASLLAVVLVPGAGSPCPDEV